MDQRKGLSWYRVEQKESKLLISSLLSIRTHARTRNVESRVSKNELDDTSPYCDGKLPNERNSRFQPAEKRARSFTFENLLPSKPEPTRVLRGTNRKERSVSDITGRCTVHSNWARDFR